MFLFWIEIKLWRWFLSLRVAFDVVECTSLYIFLILCCFSALYQVPITKLGLTLILSFHSATLVKVSMWKSFLQSFNPAIWDWHLLLQSLPLNPPLILSPRSELGVEVLALVLFLGITAILIWAPLEGEAFGWEGTAATVDTLLVIGIIPFPLLLMGRPWQILNREINCFMAKALLKQEK